MKRPFRFLIVALFAALILFLSFTHDAYATHDDFVVGGREITGLSRGPAFQIYSLAGVLRLTRFVLNSDFTEVIFQHDLDATPATEHERILVCGRETGGLNRGPAFQIWDRDGNLLFTRFALNGDFIDVGCLGLDTDGGADEVIVWGRETTGLARGWAVQVWDQAGNLKSTVFLLNQDFTSDLFIDSEPRQPPFPLPIP